MTKRVRSSSEAGFALFDALVGLALASIVLVSVSAGLTQVGAIRDRLSGEAAIRDQLMAVDRALRRMIDDARGPGSHSARPESLTGDTREFRVSEPLLSGGGTLTTIRSRLAIEADRHGQRHLVLHRAIDGAPEARDPILGPASALAFAYIVLTEAGETRVVPEIPDRSPLVLVRLTVRMNRSDAERRIDMPLVGLARPICVARPFVAECAP